MAFKDDAGSFHLYYVCPISWSLIAEPVMLMVFDELRQKPAIEILERSSLQNYLKNHPAEKTSPVSKRLIITSGDLFPELQAQYDDYIHKLKKELKDLALQNEDAHDYNP